MIHRVYSSIVVLAVLAGSSSASAFTSSHVAMTRFKRPRTSTYSAASAPPIVFSSNVDTSLAMLDQPAAFTLVTPLLSYSFAMPFLSQSLVEVDPATEAQLLTDMAHVALDLTTYFGPATIAIRLFAIVGRLLAIGADYIPDHAMNVEEVIFQAGMLFIASMGFVKSLHPTIMASFAQTTVRDYRIFLKTFSRAGMTWMQYKTMAAVALEWMQVEGGTIITTEEEEPHDYFYLLYDGTAILLSQDHYSEVQAPLLLGEMRFARQLDGITTHDDDIMPKMTIKAGAHGATLLRIQSSKLASLMRNDANLAKCIRALIVKGMQEKLSTAMRRTATV